MAPGRRDRLASSETVWRRIGEAVIGSPIAYLALLLWIPFSLALFAVMRPTTAAYFGLLAAAMFLPERVAFDAPLVPPLNKYTLSALCALVGVVLTDRAALKAARPLHSPEVFGLVAVIGVLGTVQTNRDSLTFGELTLPGMTLHDGISGAIQVVMELIMPFLLGLVLFKTRRDLRDLLWGLMFAGLVYLPLILLELRLSPQLHTWVYGYFQHSWHQVLRDDAYRPIAFMPHGLALAMFVVCAVIAAWSLKQARSTIGPLTASVPAWILLGTLAAIHSLGALVYGLAIVPLVRFASVSRQSRIAVLLAALVLTYPVLRATDAFPTRALTDWAGQVSPERAQSLQYRFDQEDRLLDKARERPWFGWGLWGRNRVYNERGRDISTTDGAWIIVLGSTGVVGFITRFALLLIPVYSARRRLAQLPDEPTRRMLAGVILITAVSAVDLLPNGLFTHLPVFFAGALAGLSKGLVVESSLQPGIPYGTRWQGRGQQT